MARYFPIDAFKLPEVGEVPLRGLIVITGPNSSGKTQLMRDVNAVACGEKRKPVVASGFHFAPYESKDSYLKNLVESSRFKEDFDSDGRRQFRRTIRHQQGTDISMGVDVFSEGQFDGWYQRSNQFAGKWIEDFPPNEFMVNFGSLYCTALFLENRLNLMRSTGNFDYRRESAASTMQALLMQSDAQDAITNEMSQVFQRGVWLDWSRNKLDLLVSDSISPPPLEERARPQLMKEYRTIESEGDGMRSYAAICTTLLLGEMPLCLIDEPEMCLHPPQAYRIGRFIGNHKLNADSCVIVATHSSHVLRGILDTESNTTVIRLRRIGSKFTAKKVDPTPLREATSKPASKSESILDGMLSDGVIICEADGDRVVYESTFRSLKDPPLDLRFVPVGGTGGFVEPLRLYRALGVPVAAILDIDLLGDAKKVGEIVSALGTNDGVRELCIQVARIAEEVKATGPGISVREAISLVSDLIKQLWDPTQDIGLAKELKGISNRLSRFRELKRQGVEGISDPDLRSEAQGVIDRLKVSGLFLVPVGELECWLREEMRSVSKENKSEWATTAATLIEGLSPMEGDIWGFMRDVLGFVNARAKEA